MSARLCNFLNAIGRIAKSKMVATMKKKATFSILSTGLSVFTSSA